MAAVNVIAEVLNACAKYGKQIGKVSNKGVACFERSAGYANKVRTIVNAETGKVLSKQTFIPYGNDFKWKITRTNAEGIKLSEATIAPGIVSKDTFGFPVGHLYMKPDYYPKCSMRTPVLTNSYTKYNKFGQVVEKRANTMTLSSTKPEMRIDSVTNGEESTRIIDISA